MAISFPRTFANLTLAQLSYLDENFAAINSAINAVNGIAGLDGTGKVSPSVIPPGATAGPMFAAYLAGSQSVSSGVYTKLTAGTEDFDTAANYDNLTNYRFTPSVAGKYLVYGQIAGLVATSGQTFACNIRKNNNSYQNTFINTSVGAGALVTVVACAILNMNGTTDFVELWGMIFGTGALSFSGGSDRNCSFGAHFIG